MIVSRVVLKLSHPDLTFAYSCMVGLGLVQAPLHIWGGSSNLDLLKIRLIGLGSKLMFHVLLEPVLLALLFRSILKSLRMEI